MTWLLPASLTSSPTTSPHLLRSPDGGDSVPCGSSNPGHSFFPCLGFSRPAVSTEDFFSLFPCHLAFSPTLDKATPFPFF